MIAERITTIDQAQAMREIRNLCREGYVRFNEIISMEQQQEWWMKNRDTAHGFLFLSEDKVFGFGVLVLYPDGKYWATDGVRPEFRGMGYGREILSYLARIKPEVWSDCRKDNIPAVRQHHPIVWTRYGEDENTITFYSGKVAIQS
jgi:GNAT superfamily N-acetyltransferase